MTSQEGRFPFGAGVTGWFCLGLSSELPAGAVRSLTRFGRELVMFRGEGGQVGVLEAYCPHMGAHLGQGCVEGDGLRCPFHRFHFSQAGTCLGLGQGYSGRVSPSLRVGAFAVQERDGFILCWHDPQGRAPFIELPTHDHEGWTSIRSKSWEVRTHPQETGEGSVDIGHLSAVHLYREVAEIEPITFEGPYLRAGYRAVRQTDPGMRGEQVTLEFRPRLHGLGWSTVAVSMVEYGLQMRLWILATPIDTERMDYRVAMSLRLPESPGRLNPMLRLLPRALSTHIVHRISWQAYVHDVELDLPVWEQKAYVHPPRLARGDGPIVQFRNWARQFYGVEAAAVG